MAHMSLSIFISISNYVARFITSFALTRYVSRCTSISSIIPPHISLPWTAFDLLRVLFIVLKHDGSVRSVLFPLIQNFDRPNSFRFTLEKMLPILAT